MIGLLGSGFTIFELCLEVFYFSIWCQKFENAGEWEAEGSKLRFHHRRPRR